MHRTARKLVASALCLAFAAPAAFAQTRRDVKVDFQETTLKNGLRVLTVEDHSAPVVSISVTYNVGSRDERPGRTGFAHLFEHMMFKGSQNVGSGEHFVLVFNNGGSMNGTTNADRTNYFESLPANQLELAVFLEADRMRSLEITKANLDNQRNAVQEERRLRLDNQPYGKSDERMGELLYDNFAYKHSTIGSMEDLNAASVEDVAQFFKTYYAPNNAVLTLVGDFRRDQALALIRKYFEDIPRQSAPPAVDMTEPKQTAERRETMDDPLARLPQIDVAYKTAPGNTPDYYAMYVLNSALQGGQSSRLYQKLVKERELATSVGGYVDERRGASALYISATPRPGVKPEALEAAMYEEIDRLRREGVSDAELQKAKNNARRQYVTSLTSSLSRALQLGQFAVYYNDPNLINARLSKIEAVTARDVQRVADQYLPQTNRTVVVTLPKRAGAPAARSNANEQSGERRKEVAR